MLRHLYGQSLAEVAAILRVECQGRIFRMARKEYLAALACHHHVHARLLTLGEYIQFRTALYIFATHLRVAAVRHIELIVKTTKDR